MAFSEYLVLNLDPREKNQKFIIKNDLLIWLFKDLNK